MQNTHFWRYYPAMKRRFVIWLILGLISRGGSVFGQSLPTNSTELETQVSSYFFISAELLTFIDQKPFPAVGVSKKRIYVSKDGAIEELKLSAPIGLKLKPCVTDVFIKVEDPAITFDNTHAARVELRLWSELSYSQSASDAEISDLRTSIPGTPNDELISQEEGYREFMENSIDEGRMHEDRFADTVNMKFTLSPNQDMEEVYVACGISYDLPTSKSKEPQRGSRMAVHYLGNLSEGTPAVFNIRKPFARFKPVNVKCELFFYKGKAEPIAHTLSRKLRALNMEEAVQVRELLN